MGFIGSEDVQRLTFVYDFRYGKWKQGPDLPNYRIDFACAADSSKGLIYIAGGKGYGRAVAVYNVEEEKWEDLPYIEWTFLRTCYSAFSDGKLYVVQGYTNWPSVACYDPNKQQWLYIAKFRYNIFSFHYRLNSPPLPAFGRLFFAADGRVMEYDFVEKRFRAVGKHYLHLNDCGGMPLWKGQIVMYGTDYDCCKLYLFEPGDEGTEGKWTLLNSWPREELGHYLDNSRGTLIL